VEELQGALVSEVGLDISRQGEERKLKSGMAEVGSVTMGESIRMRERRFSGV